MLLSGSPHLGAGAAGEAGGTGPRQRGQHAAQEHQLQRHRPAHSHLRPAAALCNLGFCNLGLQVCGACCIAVGSINTR